MDEALTEERTRITEKPDLAPVLGQLDDEQRARVMEQLEAADARFASLRDELAERSGRDTWTTTGVVLEHLESGQARLLAEVDDPDQGLTFTLELRPRNFFDENPWRPGQAPRPMATDAWDLEGGVLVMRETRISGRKYTVQETAEEIPETRITSLDEAIAAFAAKTNELAELALSRDPVPTAWYEDDEADAGGDEDADDEQDDGGAF